MRIGLMMPARLLSAVVLAGCSGTQFNPATNNDTTPPDIGLRVTGDAQVSIWNATTGQLTTKIAIAPLDVGAQPANTPITVTSVPIHEHGEATVLATAQDNESGVNSLLLTCQRRVYYNYAGPGLESEAVLEVNKTQQNNQVGSNGQVPLTGISQQQFNMWGRMVFPTAQGTPRRAHRVSFTCTAEAKNFRGLSVRTKPVLVWAQDRAVQP